MVAREEISFRMYQPSDLQALVDVSNAVYIALGDERRSAPEELRMNLEAPEFDPEHNAFVAEHNGQVIGFADLDFSRESGHGWSSYVVHPDYGNHQVGRELLHLTEARCLERAQAESAPDQSVWIQRVTPERNTSAIRLFEAEGYQQVRTFYQMRLELDQQVDVPPLPDGLSLRPYEPSRDAYALYEAFQDAFSDHWGFERDSFEEFEHYILQHPKTDPSLWLLAYDGDEIAGYCLNRRFGDEDPRMGWIWELGVRRPCRRRGLGYALLKRSLALFQSLGYPRAGLGVDSASLTHATALYERAGMHVHSRSLLYRKILRDASG